MTDEEHELLRLIKNATTPSKKRLIANGWLLEQIAESFRNKDPNHRDEISWSLLVRFLKNNPDLLPHKFSWSLTEKALQNALARFQQRKNSFLTTGQIQKI